MKAKGKEDEYLIKVNGECWIVAKDLASAFILQVAGKKFEILGYTKENLLESKEQKKLEGFF